MMSWQQQFQRCYDKLVLRVGGPGGPLIRWHDRGHGGEFTWSSDDPEGEVRDISHWTGEGSQIRLYAMVLEGSTPQSPLCEMTTLHDGEVCKQWRFDADEDHEIVRGHPSSGCDLIGDQ
jgi:hypothetical protein